MILTSYIFCNISYNYTYTFPENDTRCGWSANEGHSKRTVRKGMRYIECVAGLIGPMQLSAICTRCQENRCSIDYIRMHSYALYYNVILLLHNLLTDDTLLITSAIVSRQGAQIDLNCTWQCPISSVELRPYVVAATFFGAESELPREEKSCNLNGSHDFFKIDPNMGQNISRSMV